ncbi:MAG: OmpA family protein [Actinobacteria bacterium]|nr:OmpA family protein [Actinomycetota bacterium]
MDRGQSGREHRRPRRTQGRQRPPRDRHDQVPRGPESVLVQQRSRERRGGPQGLFVDGRGRRRRRARPDDDARQHRHRRTARLQRPAHERRLRHQQQRPPAGRQAHARRLGQVVRGQVGDKRSINQTVNLEGHASATGNAEHNLDLATKRVAAVSDYLGTHGFSNVATRATPKPKGAAEAHGARTSAIAASTWSSATAVRRSSRCTSSVTPSASTTSTPTPRCTAAAARRWAMP